MRPVVIVFYFQPFNFDGHYIYFMGFFPTSQRARERMREKERKRERLTCNSIQMK